jgi:uncharacterized protein YecE (DUF72 family)
LISRTIRRPRQSNVSGRRAVLVAPRQFWAFGTDILFCVSVLPILLGTSSFTASGWEGSFYPRGMRSADYLAFYAEHFHTVEVDSTFYGSPSARTVRNWAARTPEKFVFSIKVPQTITHERVLVDCDAELNEFLETMGLLGPKLGPMVFQFPAFDRWKFPTQNHFLDVLVPFLDKLPKDKKFAIEIRNRQWLDHTFADVLRERGIALVLQDIPNMPGPEELTKKLDPITADWTYIRWLGDRKGIEKLTMTWDKAVVDRSSELSSWVDFCDLIRKRGVVIYAYANNHYSGHGPATIVQFAKLWSARGLPEITRPPRTQPKPTLFPM